MITFATISASNYMLKVNNRNTRTRCEIWCLIVNFDHSSHFVLVFLKLTLSRLMLAGIIISVKTKYHLLLTESLFHSKFWHISHILLACFSIQDMNQSTVPILDIQMLPCNIPLTVNNQNCEWRHINSEVTEMQSKFIVSRYKKTIFQFTTGLCYK